MTPQPRSRGTTTGNRNLALGQGAGSALTSGSNNVYLAHPGVATESKTLRLGNIQTRAFVAGVAGQPVSGNAVIVTSTGQLGVQLSSARYKEDIRPLGDQGDRLRQLRPVTFRYKDEAAGHAQFGLIAEEVAGVYPELVTRDAGGAIEGVQYHELAPLLMHELQRQQRLLAELEARNDSLQAAVDSLLAREAAAAAWHAP